MVEACSSLVVEVHQRTRIFFALLEAVLQLGLAWSLYFHLCLDGMSIGWPIVAGIGSQAGFGLAVLGALTVEQSHAAWTEMLEAGLGLCLDCCCGDG